MLIISYIKWKNIERMSISKGIFGYDELRCKKILRSHWTFEIDLSKSIVTIKIEKLRDIKEEG